MPSGAPMLATKATVTTAMRNDIIEKLDMAGCCILTESPNKPNITYEAVRKNTIEEDVNCVVRDVAENNIKAQRVVVYCQSLDMCASLYAHFLQAQDASYYIHQVLTMLATTDYLQCSTPVLTSIIRGW